MMIVGRIEDPAWQRASATVTSVSLSSKSYCNLRFHFRVSPFISHKEGFKRNLIYMLTYGFSAMLPPGIRLDLTIRLILTKYFFVCSSFHQ